jgi:hypothetical protein
MNQKIIQVGNKKLLVLDMPEDANSDNIEHVYAELYYCSETIPLTHLCEIGYNCEILGFKTDLTESQWAEIVEVSNSGMHPDYHITNVNKIDRYVFHTAEWSGLSLLQANDCNYNNALIIEIL